MPESQMAQFHSNQDNTAGTGADGLSPMEGVPELRLAVNSSWTPSVAAAGMYHQQQQRSSSPIKGVVSHAAHGNNGILQPQDAPQQDLSFGFDDDDYGDDFGGGFEDYGASPLPSSKKKEKPTSPTYLAAPECTCTSRIPPDPAPGATS